MAAGRRHADRAADAPVLAAGPVEQALVDEVAAQRRGVGVPRAEDQVDLALAVAPPGLELLGQPVEHDQPLAVRRRDRRDAGRRATNASSTLRRVAGLGRRARRAAGGPARPGPPAGTPRRATTSVPSSPATTARRRRAGRAPGWPGRRRARWRRRRASSAGGAERQRGDDAAAVVVGEQPDERRGVERPATPRQYPASTSTGPMSSSPSAKRRTLARDPLGEQRRRPSPACCRRAA